MAQQGNVGGGAAGSSRTSTKPRVIQVQVEVEAPTDAVAFTEFAESVKGLREAAGKLGSITKFQVRMPRGIYGG